MMGRSLFAFRLKIVGACCVVGVFAVFARMCFLSVVEGPDLVGQAKRITCGETVEISYRGPVLDRNGVALAASMESYRVALRRAVYRYDKEHASMLAPQLDIGRAELDKILSDDPRKFIWLSKGVGTDQANALRGLRVPGVDIHRDQDRSYPHGPLAAHVIGFSGVDAQGLEGIERVYDAEITGEPVKRRVCKDARGRVFLDGDSRGGLNRGATVELTIDATLQSIAESELLQQVEETEAHGGSVVILDPQTGAVLAMANAPTFDPNHFNHVPAHHRRNRAITDIFEPGSTMKPFLVAAAMETGTVKASDKFDCENGAMRVGGWEINDTHDYEMMTVSEIVRVSSNIGSAKIGFELGSESLYEYLLKFGFARKTGINMPGEVVGLLMPPKSWRKINLANISFGQGISVTPLQLAAGFATLANDGVRMKPFVVRRVTSARGEVLEYNVPTSEGRVVAADVARQVSAMLETVVSEEGTAPRAQVEGVRVAGKTGTAQKVVDKRYSHKHWVASFAGYVPADDPRLVIVVTVDEPQTHHYGGLVAAPVFRRIAEASLDYIHVHREPDLPVEELDDEAAPGSGKSEGDGPRTAPLPVPLQLAELGKFSGKMPDLRGHSLRSAMLAMDGCDCAVDVDGNGYVIEQAPEPGTAVAVDGRVALTLASASAP
jgi:cell division protein FtsI (penicillin-binding protein 3)